jgi:hypothetical protein
LKISRNYDLVGHRSLLRQPIDAAKRALGLPVANARRPRSVLEEIRPLEIRRRAGASSPRVRAETQKTRIEKLAADQAAERRLTQAIERCAPLLEQVNEAQAGYQMACACMGEPIQDKATLRRLRAGQAALDESRRRLPLGRGNVAKDIGASSGEAYVAVQRQRDAVEFLKASLRQERPAQGAKLSALRQGLVNLKDCWPEGFAEQLNSHFPEQQAAKEVLAYISMTACAIHYGAGNCGEHARLALHMHTKSTDASDTVCVAKTDGINHAWAEIRVHPDRTSDDDILLDLYLQSPAILRRHSRFGKGQIMTTVEQSSTASRRWIAQQVDNLTRMLQERPDILDGLTANTAKLARQKYLLGKLQGAEESVPLALSDQFLQAATAAATDAPSKYASMPIVRARDKLLTDSPAAGKGWEDKF